MAKKFANAGERKKPIVFDGKARQRKANPTKGGIIAELATFLTENPDLSCENVQITNKQGKVEFTVGENSFSFSLTQHRKK